MKVVGHWYDEYGNLVIQLDDGTVIGGAMAEDYARRYGLD